MYNLRLVNRGKTIYNSGSHTCRETLTVSLLKWLANKKQARRNIENCHVVMEAHYSIGVSAYLPEEYNECLERCIELFSVQLVKDIARAQRRLMGQAKVELTKFGQSGYKVRMPGWVINNPYLPSFYLGTLMAFSDNLNYGSSRSLKSLNACKDYKKMLKIISRNSSHELPVYGEVNRRVESLLFSSKKKKYYKNFLDKSDGSIYWDPENGFNEWYDSHGRNIKRKAAR